MKTRIQVITLTLLLGTLTILGVVWWMNGQDDTWFYIAAAVIVLSSIIPMWSREKKDKNNTQ